MSSERFSCECRPQDPTAPLEAAGPLAVGGLLRHERGEREDAALALVVGAHHEHQVLERDDDDQRPRDQRQHG